MIHQLLLVVQILVAAGIIGLVLLQQGRGADAGAAFGSGGSGSLFGSRGAASFLSKITGLLAVVFFANSIGLAYLSVNADRQNSVTERFEAVAPASDVPVPVPVPLLEESGGDNQEGGTLTTAPGVPVPDDEESTAVPEESGAPVVPDAAQTNDSDG